MTRTVVVFAVSAALLAHCGRDAKPAAAIPIAAKPKPAPPASSGGTFGGVEPPATLPYQHPIYRFPPSRHSVVEPVRDPAVRAVPISTPPPIYPKVAARARIGGIVVLELLVDRDGRVLQGHVLKPLPFGLDQAAIEAVRNWRYKPARDGYGQPVASIVEVAIPMHPPGAQ